jgi:hypothetical protein
MQYSQWHVFRDMVLRVLDENQHKLQRQQTTSCPGHFDQHDSNIVRNIDIVVSLFNHIHSLLGRFLSISPEEIRSNAHDIIPTLDKVFMLLTSIAASCLSVCGGVLVQNFRSPAERDDSSGQVTTAFLDALFAIDVLASVVTDVFVPTFRFRDQNDTADTGNVHGSRRDGGIKVATVTLIHALENCAGLWSGVIDILMKLFPLLIPQAFQAKPGQGSPMSTSATSAASNVHVECMCYIRDKVVGLCLRWFDLLADVLPLHFFHHCRFGLPILKALLTICNLSVCVNGGVHAVSFQDASASHRSEVRSEVRQGNQSEEEGVEFDFTRATNEGRGNDGSKFHDGIDSSSILSLMQYSQSIVVKMLRFSSKFDVDVINGLLGAVTELLQHASKHDPEPFLEAIRVHVGLLAALTDKILTPCATPYSDGCGKRTSDVEKEDNSCFARRKKQKTAVFPGRGRDVVQSEYGSQRGGVHIANESCNGIGRGRGRRVLQRSELKKVQKVWGALASLMRFTAELWTCSGDDGSDEANGSGRRDLRNGVLIEALLSDVLELLGVFVEMALGYFLETYSYHSPHDYHTSRCVKSLPQQDSDSEQGQIMVNIACVAVVFVDVVISHAPQRRSDDGDCEFWHSCGLPTLQPLSLSVAQSSTTQSPSIARNRCTHDSLVGCLAKIICRCRDIEAILTTGKTRCSTDKIGTLSGAVSVLLCVNTGSSITDFHRATVRLVFWRSSNDCSSCDGHFDRNRGRQKCLVEFLSVLFDRRESGIDGTGDGCTETSIGNSVMQWMQPMVDRLGSEAPSWLGDGEPDNDSLSTFGRINRFLARRVVRWVIVDTPPTSAEDSQQLLSPADLFENQWHSLLEEDDLTEDLAPCRHLFSTQPSWEIMLERIPQGKLEVGLLMASLLDWQTVWCEWDPGSSLSNPCHGSAVLAMRMSPLCLCLDRTSSVFQKRVCGLIDDPLLLLRRPSCQTNGCGSDPPAVAVKPPTADTPKKVAHNISPFPIQSGPQLSAAVCVVKLILNAEEVADFPSSLTDCLDRRKRSDAAPKESREDCSSTQHEAMTSVSVQKYIARCNSSHILALCTVSASAKCIADSTEEGVVAEVEPTELELAMVLLLARGALRVLLADVQATSESRVNAACSNDGDIGIEPATADSDGIDIAIQDVLSQLFEAMKNFMQHHHATSSSTSSSSLSSNLSLAVLETAQEACLIMKELCYRVPLARVNWPQNSVNDASSILHFILSSISSEQPSEKAVGLQVKERQVLDLAQSICTSLDIVCCIGRGVLTAPAHLIDCLDILLLLAHQPETSSVSLSTESPSSATAYGCVVAGTNLWSRAHLFQSPVDMQRASQRDGSHARDAMERCLYLALSGDILGIKSRCALFAYPTSNMFVNNSILL